MLTIWFGHVLLGMAYATVVVQARLFDLNPQLEEAAMDPAPGRGRCSPWSRCR